MATIRSCDKCHTKQRRDGKYKGWLSISIHADNLKKIDGLESGWMNWDFCPACGEKMVKSFTGALKKK